MLRAILGMLCLAGMLGFMSSGDAKAAQKKKGAYGKFKSYKDGTLTIMAGKKGEEKETTFKVAADFKCEVFTGEDKKEVVAKDAFKDLAEGTRILIMNDGDKVGEVKINPPKKKKS